MRLRNVYIQEEEKTSQSQGGNLAEGLRRKVTHSPVVVVGWETSRFSEEPQGRAIKMEMKKGKRG